MVARSPGLALILVLFAARAHAQSDTLDWHRYYPLTVGNTWEYVGEYHLAGEVAIRLEVVGDTTLGVRRIFEIERARVEDWGNRTDTIYAAYDEESGRVLLGRWDTVVDTSTQEIPCYDSFDIRAFRDFDLRRPFGDSLVCPDSPYIVQIEGAYDSTVLVGASTYSTAALKRFFEPLSNGHVYKEVVYAADIGMVAGNGPGNTWEERLTFARISGREYGAASVGIERTDRFEVPSVWTLSQNYPNPFNPQTTLPYTLPRAGHVRLAVTDLLGRQVALLVDAYTPPGRHEAVFDALDLPSGPYLFQLETEGGTQVRIGILAK